ncbi:MAG TPA: alpha/beta hydrolase-fold protein [Gemmatimonadales bacterium]|nr:alpha/beta hydrolase-fold protein [Gemmatimonadales bacterium]
MHPLLVALVLVQADAGTPLEIGRTIQIQSRALAEQRTIDVSLPAGYATDTTQRYPVLIVLDGEFEHQTAASTARFYAGTGQIPALIVVGIRNVNRMRDMTTSPAAGFDTPPEALNAGAGGADKFLHFIGDELLPYLDDHYRTAPMRVIIGHSLGGLLSIYALGSRPGLFSGYVLLEPSAWWNGGKEVKAAQAVLRQPAGKHARVMLVNTESWELDTTSWGSTKPMIREISVTGETHASMAVIGMAQGLRTLFADFKPRPWQPGHRPIAMLEQYDSLAARVGYPVPIPLDAYATVARMSLDSRHFDDAERVVTRMGQAYPASAEYREYKDRLSRERNSPKPAAFIPLEFPARRPTPGDARAFLGRWETMSQADTHQVAIRASGDTIVVHDRVQMPGIDWFEADDPVIQVRPDGTLEWGLPFFRGIAALVVLEGRIQTDGTMVVTREVRGWVPRGPGSDLNRTERFRRVASPNEKTSPGPNGLPDQ